MQRFKSVFKERKQVNGSESSVTFFGMSVLCLFMLTAKNSSSDHDRSPAEDINTQCETLFARFVIPNYKYQTINKSL